MTEQVLVIETEKTNNIQFNNGFFPITRTSLMGVIKTGKFISRELAERSPQFKQIIPYSLLRWGNQVFRYQRTRSGGEKRLFNLFSIGVGGHVNPIDMGNNSMDVFSIIEAARTREILEEFDCRLMEPPRLIGMLNDNSNEVGSVHLGIVYEYELQSSSVKPNEMDNFSSYDLVEKNKLLIDIDNFETWSQIVIREYLAKPLSAV